MLPNLPDVAAAGRLLLISHAIISLLSFYLASAVGVELY